MSSSKCHRRRNVGLTCVLIGLVAIYTFVSAPSESKASADPEENAAVAGELLSTIAYGPKDSQRKLSLWKVPVPNLSPSQFIGLHATEEATRIFSGRSARALLLVDSEQGDPSTGKIVMAHYIRKRAGGHHSMVLSTAVQYSESAKKAYVAVTRSLGGHNITLKLFEVDLGNVLADFPYKFEPQGYPKAWPKPSTPISNAGVKLGAYKYSLGHLSSVHALKLDVQTDHLLVKGLRDNANAPAIFFRYDLKTRELFHNTVIPVPSVERSILSAKTECDGLLSQNADLRREYRIVIEEQRRAREHRLGGNLSHAIDNGDRADGGPAHQMIQAIATMRSRGSIPWFLQHVDFELDPKSFPKGTAVTASSHYPIAAALADIGGQAVRAGVIKMIRYPQDDKQMRIAAWILLKMEGKSWAPVILDHAIRQASDPDRKKNLQKARTLLKEGNAILRVESQK